jgi:phage I-like protein
VAKASSQRRCFAQSRKSWQRENTLPQSRAQHPVQTENPETRHTILKPKTLTKKMNKELIQLLGLAAEATPEDILGAVAELKAKIAAHEAQKQKTDALEKAIAEKVRLGLTREQAINALNRQEAFDAAKTKTAPQH